MVDNAWRDSFVVKVHNRGPREYEDVEREDNSSLLALERQSTKFKAISGEGLFAGTSFEVPTSAPNMISYKGPSMAFQEEHETEKDSCETDFEKLDEDVKDQNSKDPKRKNRATLAFEEFSERIGSSGSYRRKNSRDGSGDREKSTQSVDSDKPKSKTRVTSVVSRLSRVTSRRKTKVPENADQSSNIDDSAANSAANNAAAAESQSIYVANNPSYLKKDASVAE